MGQEEPWMIKYAVTTAAGTWKVLVFRLTAAWVNTGQGHSGWWDNTPGYDMFVYLPTDKWNTFRQSPKQPKFPTNEEIVEFLRKANLQGALKLIKVEGRKVT